jgi:hypothetical protein
VSTLARDIPVAKTPPGGYGTEMPPPILAGCDEPLVEGAPDLRGTWKAVDVTSGGEPMPAEHPLWQHVERIEQAGDRFVVTTQGIVHDGFADGTLEHGVHDVMATDFTTPIAVVASYEDGALVLRPDGMEGVEVKRWREGDEPVWEYFVLFTVRMVRA